MFLIRILKQTSRICNDYNIESNKHAVKKRLACELNHYSIEISFF